MRPIGSSEIAAAFLAACRAELRALKPGNVHDLAAGHGLVVDDFERSAVAAAPWIARAGAPVGARVRGAAEATLAAVSTNTNLGILLLCAPLAVAAERAGADLRERLAAVLRSLDVADAGEVFAAIVAMRPAGLGRVAAHDVAAPATVTLLEAMTAAAERDRIARAYATGFAEIFDTALPRLREAQARLAASDLAVTDLHMALLAAEADSHIARKHGQVVAEAVRHEAARLMEISGGVVGRSHLPVLAAFDDGLKRRGLNPGTTADLVVATLFADRLDGAAEAPGPAGDTPCR